MTMNIVSTAAAVLMVIGVATLWPVSTKSATSVYAQVIQQVREARSVIYTHEVIPTDGSRARKSRYYIADDGRMRREHLRDDGSIGAITISDNTGFPRIILELDTKEATVMRDPEPDSSRKTRPGGRGGMLLNQFETFRNLATKPQRDLGTKELAGRHVTGFVGKLVEQSAREHTIWIDTISEELVRIEQDTFETSMKNGEEAGERKAVKIVLTDFQFNVPMDDSLFSWELPAGYTRRPPSPPQRGGEISIVEALRGYTQHTGGLFPSSLNDWSAWSAVLSKGLDGQPSRSQALRVMAHVGALSSFLDGLPKEDYAYVGGGKTTGDTNTLIFWYKRPDGVYRAIYGDLTFRDVTAEVTGRK
jgi:outer membrane lipoprotein-sorting protein